MGKFAAGRTMVLTATVEVHPLRAGRREGHQKELINKEQLAFMSRRQ